MTTEIIDVEILEAKDSKKIAKVTAEIKKPLMSDARRRRLEELLNDHIKPLQVYIQTVENEAATDLSDMVTPQTKEKDKLLRELGKINLQLENLENKKKSETHEVLAACNVKYDKRISRAKALIAKWETEKNSLISEAESSLDAKYAKQSIKYQEKQQEKQEQLKEVEKQIKIELGVRKSVLDKITRQISSGIIDQKLKLNRELWSKNDADAEELFASIPTVEKFQDKYTPQVLAGFYLEQIKDLKIPQKCSVLNDDGVVCGGTLGAEYGRLRCQRCYTYVEVVTPSKFDTTKLLEG